MTEIHIPDEVVEAGIEAMALATNLGILPEEGEEFAAEWKQGMRGAITAAHAALVAAGFAIVPREGRPKFSIGDLVTVAPEYQFSEDWKRYTLRVVGVQLNRGKKPH